jgi:hypothetical protein
MLFIFSSYEVISAVMRVNQPVKSGGELEMRRYMVID